MNELTSFKEYLLGKRKNDVRCIWWLNIGIEDAWSAAEGYVVPRLSGKGSGSAADKSEEMCLIMADSNDIVIMKNKVPSMVLESLTSAGFDLPEIWYFPERDMNKNIPVSEMILNDYDIINRLKCISKVSESVFLVPYAVTSLEEKIASATGCRIIGASSELVEWTNSKVNARILAMEAGLPVTAGFICRSAEEALFRIIHLRDSGAAKIIIKDAYGASGRGLYIIDSQESLNLVNHMLRRKKDSKKNINVIVEKWYDTKADINYQIFVRDDGTVIFIPPKKQILSGVIYKGSEFPADHILSEGQKEFYRESAGLIGKKLFERGYRGVASIDSIITKDNAVYPVIEINGRFSLSTYISFVPALLNNTRFFTAKYYDIYSDTTVPEIFEWLRENNYTPAKREGLVLYSYAEKTGVTPGRIFVLYAYNDLYKLREKEKYVNGLFNLAVV